MARRFLIAVIALSALLTASAHAESVAVQNLRAWRAPDHTRLVFDVSAPLEYKLTTLTDPYRAVIEMEKARLTGTLTGVEPADPLVQAVRTASFGGDGLRIVIDLKAEARLHSFVLKPAGQYGHRLVVDLYDARQPEESQDVPAKAEAESPPAGKERPLARSLIIAVDAGHGGEDPGALGRRYRTREKDVTLAIARELAKLLDRQPGTKAVLIRSGDYYVGLRQRFQKARRSRADVFVSIHADAVPGKQARGSSVYALSERGATSAMARHLADRENAADLIGGVSLSDKDDVLARVLLDMSHSKTIEHSMKLGEDILGELKRVGHVHQRRVQQAGFAVLKSPDIPSVLVETAFISNPDEERKLRSPAFQRSVAQGIFKGVTRFLARQPSDTPPSRTTSAETFARPREHVVRSGETLAVIAQRYNLHIDALRFFNNLTDAEPAAGTRLRLPPEGG